MNDTLVVVCDLDRGVYQEWPNCRRPVKGILTKTEGDYFEDLPLQTHARNLPIWACVAADAEAVAEYLSAQWVGHEVKIFKLDSLMVRTVGEMRHKKITKDGVFPK